MGFEPIPNSVTGRYLNHLTSIPNNTLLSAEASHYVGCSGPNVGVVNGANRQIRTVVSGLEDQSTNHCAIFAYGAKDEIRTRDPYLGKVMLYQLSYFRIQLSSNIIRNCIHINNILSQFSVEDDGFEPPTFCM